MAIVRFDPFAELNALHNQVNSLFSGALGDSTSSDHLSAPAMDVYSDDKALTIEAALPRFKENEISLNYHEGMLEIAAEHSEKEEDKKGKKYLLRESTNRFYRRLALPKNIDEKNIEAHFENGVLKAVIPFKELPQPTKIAIKAKNK